MTQQGDGGVDMDAAVVRMSVESALGERVTDVQSIARSGERLPDVWKVRTECRTLAVKRQVFASIVAGSSHDLLQVEADVSGRLIAAGCRVAGVLAVDAGNDLVVLEWCGDQTLDDVCQQSVEGAEAVRKPFVNAFVGIEAALAAARGEFADRCFPGCEPTALRASWRNAVGDVVAVMPGLLEKTDGLDFGQQASWLALVARLGEAPPTLGALDYNARNVVVDKSGMPTFLEFSKIGWDWPERRLVQYGTSLGSGRPDGLPVCLVDGAAANAYASGAAAWRGVLERDILTLLDGHDLVFHLVAAARLLQASADSRRSTRWPNLDARLGRVMETLGRPLSDDDEIGCLRAEFSGRAKI